MRLIYKLKILFLQFFISSVFYFRTFSNVESETTYQTGFAADASVPHFPKRNNTTEEVIMRTVFEYNGKRLTIEGQELSVTEGWLYVAKAASDPTYCHFNFEIASQLHVWQGILGARAHGLKEEWIRYTPKTTVIR